ncbi:MAG: heme NO-binding domain-containing protein [Cytophagales bacterium]|nr:heme NO-binding domain-containing protein [Cytophagales bacterium]
MHGIISSFYKEFIQEEYGKEMLRQIEVSGELEKNAFSQEGSCSEYDFLALLDTSCRIVSTNREEILVSFGRYIAPIMLRTYQGLVHEDWLLFDVLENIEGVMIRTVRRHNIQAPQVYWKAISRKDDCLELSYTSPRKLASLGVGIVQALSTFFNEPIKIQRTDFEDHTVLIIIRA